MFAERLAAELKQEAGSTRRVLERVPEEQLSWRPHAKSMTLGQLAQHVANLPRAIADLVSVPVRELPVVPQPEASSRAQLLETLESSVAYAAGKLTEWGDARLGETWKLVRGEQTIMELPRIDFLRSVMFNHWYHHRGQLTVYLRLLDVPLPAVYGSSADEKPF